VIDTCLTYGLFRVNLANASFIQFLHVFERQVWQVLANLVNVVNLANLVNVVNLANLVNVVNLANLVNVVNLANLVSVVNLANLVNVVNFANLVSLDKIVIQGAHNKSGRIRV
jgi:hypothetical protein